MKVMVKRFIAILTLLYLAFSMPAFGEIIILKSGKTIESKILEKTDNSIKVDIEGVPITYYLDETQSIDGVSLNNNKTIQNNLSKITTKEIPANAIDTKHIRRILQHLGYPENTWSAIEDGLIAFLNKIDFPKLKEEAEQVKSSPSQLKEFVAKIGGLIESGGYCNDQHPRPLIKLLINSLGNGDIFQVIDSTSLSSGEKETKKRILVSCSAVSQLGNIILSLLDFKVKAIITSKHVSNCIPLDSGQILFVDFINQIFEIVSISQYYEPEGETMLLKEEYRISPDRIREIEEQWSMGVQTNSLREILNMRLQYFNIYIADDYTITSSIYSNRASMYGDKGDYDREISECNHALQLNPKLFTAYNNRGFAHINKGNYDQAISDFNKVLTLNPKDDVGYNNRGFAYIKKGNYDQAISDCTKALGINHNFAGYLLRGYAYYKKGNYGQAISDFRKVIEIALKDVINYIARGNTYIKKAN
jgi:tetratricopeptide (TPR) repeat protein